MTNDEIKQAIEQMKTSIAEIEKQLGIDINVEPPPASHPEVYGGPDEYGRVKLRRVDEYLATKNFNRDVWFLVPFIVGKQSLTDKQLANIQTNVGCDENGNLVPSGPLLYSNGNKLSSLVKPCKWGKPKYMPWAKERFIMDDYPFQDKNTVGARCNSVDEIIAEYARTLK